MIKSKQIHEKDIIFFSIEITTMFKNTLNRDHIPSGEAVFECTREVKTTRKTSQKATMLLWQWYIFSFSLTKTMNENPERENKKWVFLSTSKTKEKRRNPEEKMINIMKTMMVLVHSERKTAKFLFFFYFFPSSFGLGSWIGRGF